MKTLIVYVLAAWIFIETIGAAQNDFSSSPSEPGSKTSYSFTEVYEENPTIAKVQQLMGSLRNDPDEAITCGQMIKSRGFGLERHYVTTFDGYILQVHRIINPYARAARKCLKPVLLSHGLMNSCSVWLFAGPDGHIKPWINGNPPHDNSSSLGFLLGNVGLDVWIINARGTSYSTNHTYLDPNKDPQFWEYSFQEIGIYDVTAVVGYMKKITGQEQITLVGHSQGTIQPIIQMSVIPEFEKNYDLVILVAPIGFLGNLPSSIEIIPYEPLISRIIDTFKIPFPPGLEYINAAVGLLCQSQIFQPICLEFLLAFFGTEAQQLNTSRLSVINSVNDRTSVRNLVHYQQSELRDHIGYFDHGKDKNIELYGSSESPNFPFYRINAKKLVLISGLNDVLAPTINVQKLINSLNGPVLLNHVITDPLWAHGGFIYGIEQYEYFGKIVLDIIRRHGSDCISADCLHV